MSDRHLDPPDLNPECPYCGGTSQREVSFGNMWHWLCDECGECLGGNEGDE